MKQLIFFNTQKLSETLLDSLSDNSSASVSHFSSVQVLTSTSQCY